MSCCEAQSNGRASGSALDVLTYDRTTTDASAQTVRVATLPAIGDAVFWYLSLRGDQTNGQRGMRFNYWADASLNAIGLNGLVTGTIGPTGFTDIATPPWTTIGVPASWAINAINIAGNDVQFQWNGAAGQTVRWRVQIERILIGGAS